ncbi:GDP-L-fucose synthase family protein [Streptomyces sp. NPDC003832]
MFELFAPPARVFVAGHRGLVGAAVIRRLTDEGYEVLTRSRAELDLRDGEATAAHLRVVRPDALVLAAAVVGGIMANATRPVSFLEDNLRIQLSVISGAHAAGVRRLVFLGSSCIYPKRATVPIGEDALMTGPLEPTNEAYATAKIAGIAQVNAYRRQHGASFVSVMPTNVYGPGDNYDLDTAHVLPALIHRLHHATVTGADEVTLWGSGRPRREFLHCDDLAAACALVLRHYDDDRPLNVGSGSDIPIADLARLVADTVGYRGRVTFDHTRPDGTERKLLDSGRIAALGWRPAVTLEEGIAMTYRAWLEAGAPAARTAPVGTTR